MSGIRQASAFSHDGPGTSAEAWRAALPVVREVRLDDVARVVVVSAHPDDETLGAGGLLARAAGAGIGLDVLIATDGEGSHPHSTTHTPDRLRELRRREVAEATAELAPRRRMHLLGLPDGALAEYVPALTTALVDLVGTDGARTLLVAPWRHDGHPDHAAAARATAAAAARTDARLLEYPIWFWHWGTPEDLTGLALRRLPLSAWQQAGKATAMNLHRSQVQPLSPLPGDEALLGPRLLAHFAGPDEWFVVGSAEDHALDELHRSDTDPWQVHTSGYEAGKRDDTLEALGDRRFRRVLEVGCSVGALAAELATRADELVAVDSSEAAVETARRLLAHHPHVHLARLLVPQQWPVGAFDLVVVSEVGYFLSPHQLGDLRDRIATSLTADGCILLCHWTHPIEGWPLDGDTVHDAFTTDPRWTVRHARRRPDYRIDVLGPS